MEDKHSEKRVLFALYQPALSHEKKQFKLTLKREYLLPCASSPYVSCILKGVCIHAWGHYVAQYRDRS